MEELVFGKSSREKELHNHVNIAEPVNLETADVMRLGKLHLNLSQSFFSGPKLNQDCFQDIGNKER